MRSQSGLAHSPLPCSRSKDQTGQERASTRKVRRGRKGKSPKPTLIKVKPFQSPKPDSIPSGSLEHSFAHSDTTTRRERVASTPVNKRTVTGQWNGHHPTLNSHRELDSTKQDLGTLTRTSTRFTTEWVIGESYRSLAVTKRKQETEGAQHGKSPQCGSDHNTTHTSDQAGLKDDGSFRVPDGVILVKKADPNSTFSTLPLPTSRSFQRIQTAPSMNSLPACDKVPKPLWKRVIRGKGVAYELVFPSEKPLEIVEMKRKTMNMRMKKAEQKIKKTLQEMKTKRLAKQEKRRIEHTVKVEDVVSFQRFQAASSMNSLPACDKVPKPLWKRVIKGKGVAYELVFPSKEPLEIMEMKKKTMSMRMKKTEQRIKKTLQEVKAKRLAIPEERRIKCTVQVEDAESNDLVKSLEEHNLGVICHTRGGLSYEIPSWWDLEEEEELKEAPANDSEAPSRVDPEVADYHQRMNRWMRKRKQYIKNGFDASRDVPPYKPPLPPPRAYYNNH